MESRNESRQTMWIRKTFMVAVPAFSEYAVQLHCEQHAECVDTECELLSVGV